MNFEMSSHLRSATVEKKALPRKKKQPAQNTYHTFNIGNPDNSEFGSLV
jgi:hypothetical protein